MLEGGVSRTPRGFRPTPTRSRGEPHPIVDRGAGGAVPLSTSVRSQDDMSLPSQDGDESVLSAATAISQPDDSLQPLQRPQQLFQQTSSDPRYKSWIGF